MSESRLTWATSVPILVFLGLCSRVRPDARDRQTDRRQTDRPQMSDRRQTKASLNASALSGRRHNNATQPSSRKQRIIRNNQYQSINYVNFRNKPIKQTDGETEQIVGSSV